MGLSVAVQQCLLDQSTHIYGIVGSKQLWPAAFQQGQGILLKKKRFELLLQEWDLKFFENFLTGFVALGFFYWIPLAKQNLVENIPLAKEKFLSMRSFLCEFKEF